MLVRLASVFTAAITSTLLLYACGGGGAASAPDAGAIDGSLEAATDDGGPQGGDGDPAADAPPDVNQDPNVYPAMHHAIPLVDRGEGPLLDHPKLVTVTFAGDANRDTYRAFDQALGGTNWWQSTLMPYGISPSQVEVEVELPDTLSGTTIADAALQSYIADQVQSGVLPPPDAETLYVIYPTQTTMIDLPGVAPPCITGFGGYHGNFAMTLPPPDGGPAEAGAGSDVMAMYAVVFNCGSSNTSIASHEIAEACTDPQPAGTVAYYMTSNAAWPAPSGGEVGDLCISLPGVTEGGFALQRIYSNAAAMLSENPCQPTSSTYFAAAVRTEKSLYEGIFADGFVLVTPGASSSSLIDVFSEAALPSDVTLSVGSIQYGGGMATFTPSTWFTLSATTAHNGDAITLTVNPETSLTPGSVYEFVVRAQLGPNDTNDWPFLLKVQ